MKYRSPSFQFYAADYLADEAVQLMSLEEEGAYWRLIAYCWREGSIPADPKLLSRLCKGAPVDVISTAIESFAPHPTEAGRLVHPRLERERRKQEENRERRANAGRKGASARWQSDSDATDEDEALPPPENGNATPSDGNAMKSNSNATVLPMAKNGLSSSSSSSSSSSTSVKSNTPPLRASGMAAEGDEPEPRRPRPRWVPFPDWMPDNLKAAFADWQQHLAEKGVNPTRMQQLGWYSDCQRHGVPQAVETIRFSISKGAKSLLWDGPIQHGPAPRDSRPAGEAPSMPRPKQAEQSSKLFPEGLPPGVKKGW